jgi:drug/metabolite transporter (DMT)-like permease
MSHQREKRGISAKALVLLIVLALVWGLNWPMMKIGLSEIPPWIFRTYSSLVAGALLLGLATAGHQRILPRGPEWSRVLFVALFNVSLWQILLAYSLTLTSSGSAALFAYTMPVWVAVFGALVGDRLHARLVLALLFGMAGVALLLSKVGPQAAATPAGAVLGVGGAISWAIGTQLQMRTHWDLKAIPLAGWQLLLGTLPMVPIMVVLEGPAPRGASLISWLAWAYTAAVALPVGFTTWFKLIELTSAQVAAIASLLAPALAVVLGAVMLGEPLGWREIAATIAIVAGVVLVRGRPPKRIA